MTELAGGRLRLDHPAERVARLTIANPAKRNALDHTILDAIAEIVPSLDARCLLLTGSDGMFSAGYDIGDIPAEVFAEEAERLVAHPFSDAIAALEAYPYPTVAVLNGHALGGGLEVALSCDLRVAARGIELAMPPAKLGLVYSHTGLRRFIEAIGASRTREMFIVGRRVDAQAGERWGLVNQVFAQEELEAEALALAIEIAGNAPLSLQGNKRVIAELLAADRELDPDVERELIELRRRCFVSEDFREGVRAFGEKRLPLWQGR
ncbi:MAG: enoyl-CoA hydratase/isomerase family protein [Solirubrobacteraceae bacterium]